MDKSTASVGRVSVAAHQDNAAGESRAYSSDAADFTVDQYTHDWCVLDGTSVSVDATLPDVTTVPVGRTLHFIATNIDNTVRLVSTDNIAGAGTYSFTSVNEAVSVISDGTTWWLGVPPTTNADGAVTPAKTQKERVITADTNATVAATDRVIYVSTTGAGARTLTFPDTSIDGHRITVIMTAFSTGTYATVGIDSGEVTFTVAEQTATFVYNEAADSWHEMPGISSVDTAMLQDLLVTPIKMASAHRIIGANAAFAIADTDHYVLLEGVTDAIGITTATANPGQPVWIRLEAFTGNAYTLAVGGGTLTFNAAEEAALIVRNAADAAWEVQCLIGATIV
jgi:hypothetical protein